MPVTLSIPNPIRKVLISNSRRAVYYDNINAGSLITKKGKKLPWKFFQKQIRHLAHLKTMYCVAFIVAKKVIYIPKGLYVFGISDERQKAVWDEYVAEHVTPAQLLVGKYVLYDVDNECPVIANPKVAGEPKYESINYQKLYNGGYHPITRNKIVTAIKESFVDVVRENHHKLLEFVNSNSGRYTFETFIICPEGRGNWDIANRANIYAKCMLDLLATGKIGEISYTNPVLSDDNINVISRECYSHLRSEQDGIMFALYPTSERYLLNALDKYLSDIT